MSFGSIGHQESLSALRIIFCQNPNCGRATTPVEAESRMFNRNHCGHCGSQLGPDDVRLRTHTRDNF